MSTSGSCCMSEGDPCERTCPQDCCGKPRWKSYAMYPNLAMRDPWARVFFFLTFTGKTLFDFMIFQLKNPELLAYDVRWGQSLPAYAFWLTLFICSMISIVKFRWEILPALLAAAGGAGRLTWAYCTEPSATCWSGSPFMGAWMEWSALAAWGLWLLLCSYMEDRTYAGGAGYPANIAGAYDAKASQSLLQKPQALPMTSVYAKR